MKKLVVIILIGLLGAQIFAIDIQRFKPIGQNQAILTTFSWLNEKPLEKALNVSLFWNYVKNPLEFGTLEDDRLDSIIDDLHTANLGITYQFSDDLLIFGEISASFVQSFERVLSSINESSFQQLNDIHLGVLYRFYKKEKKFLKNISLYPYIYAPTGENKI